MITNLSQNSKQNGMVISVRKRYLSSGYYFSLVFIGIRGPESDGDDKKEQESNQKYP